MKAIDHWRLAGSILAGCSLWMAAPDAGSRPAVPGGVSDPTPAVAPASQDTPPPASEYYGVVGHSLDDVLFGAMGAAGVRWVRNAEAFSREAVHLGPGQYDWNLPDYNVTQAVQNQIQLLAVLWITPRWDSMLPPTDPMYWTTPPRSYEQWGDYVFQTVSRYKDRVHYWEVWNEEDIPLGWWSGTAADYTHLLAVAYTQIKRADPAATVLIGGFMGGAFNDSIYDEGRQFIRDMVADQINPVAGHFDVMNIHVYGTQYEIRSQMLDWWQTLAEIGLDDRPLWVTEFGWPSEGDEQVQDPDFCCGPEAQASYLRTLMPEIVQVWGAWKVFWFSIWVQNDPDLGEWQYYGLLDFLFQPRPAYDALKDLIASSGSSSSPSRQARAFSRGANGGSWIPSNSASSWRRLQPAAARPANRAWGRSSQGCGPLAKVKLTASCAAGLRNRN